MRGVEFGVAGLLVLRRQLALRGVTAGARPLGGAGAVGGHAGEGLGKVEVPGALGQLRAAAGGGRRIARGTAGGLSRVMSWMVVLMMLMVCSVVWVEVRPV